MTEALYIGLMSGTSADAIDGALVDFQGNFPRIIATHSHPIPDSVREAVFALALPREDEINSLRRLDRQLGLLFSETVSHLWRKAGVTPSAITAIGSHGQTVRHLPPTDGQWAYSLQVGDPNIIAETTGIDTVADFRRRDIAAGGHGAPLASALHRALFHSSEVDRIILNTGGIANITHLPTSGMVTGFDTGPANGLLDAWCQLHRGESYDREGRWALSGQSNPDLLGQLLSHPYFALPPPNSPGREEFNLSWVQQTLADWGGSGKKIAPADVQATLLALSTEAIATSIEIVDPNALSAVYICGGGAHNQALCQRLAERLAPRVFASTDVLGLPPDWVEAVTFAWLARQTMERQAGNLPAVTGAGRPVILGGIYPGMGGNQTAY